MSSYLKQIEETEESYQLYYSYIKHNDNNWKINLGLSCMALHQTPPKQDNLSDYEYFKQLYQVQKQNELVPTQNYILVVNGIPVTSVGIMMRHPHIADISYTTATKYRRRGYATQAVSLVEQRLFQNPDILFTTILDISLDNISSKIALKLGYTYDEDTNYFIKANPNIDLEALIQQNHKTIQ